MVDVWDEESFPNYARMDWWIYITLYMVATMCIIVGVVPVGISVGIFMHVLALLFLFGLKLPIYLVEDPDGEDSRLVEGTYILRHRAYYWAFQSVGHIGARNWNS